MKKLLAAALLAAGMRGQTQIDLRTQSKSVDFSGAQSTRPVKLGSVLPSACTAGELFFKSDAVSGRNLYGCVESDTWMPLAGGAAMMSGCGLTGCEEGQCQIDSAVVPSYSGPLVTNGLVVSQGASVLGTMAPGPAGYILISSGADAPPAWSPTVASHAALSKLDYASSGHTGFQPALGFTPERQLAFATPLVRSGNTISCPTCGGAGDPRAKFAVDFVEQTTITVPGSAHGLGMADLNVTVFDASTPRKRIEPDAFTVDPSTNDVTITFFVAQSGRLVLE